MTAEDPYAALEVHRNRIQHDDAYNPDVYLSRAQIYLDLNYPDLASGEAYRAVLLTDYAREYTEEGELSFDGLEHKEEDDEEEDEEERLDAIEFNAATLALKHVTGETELRALEESALVLLIRSLFQVGCIAEATAYCQQAVRRFPANPQFTDLQKILKDSTTPKTGSSRRHVYPWNHYEPDRFSPETIALLNSEFVPQCSDSVEIKVLDLPLLRETEEPLGTTQHLGVFATRDIGRGEVCLREESALTVVTDPTDSGLCEYCGQRWRPRIRPTRPTLNLSPSAPSTVPPPPEEAVLPPREIFTCALCTAAEAAGIDTVIPHWCSPHCRDSAIAKYHPTLCSRPAAPFHRAAAGSAALTSAATSKLPGGAVYTLLVLKTFAMARTQNIHPLLLPETKFLYGVPRDIETTIPWGWEENVRGPIDILDALNVDVFDPVYAGWWDTWVVNTLLAKFRGVASGRLDPDTGKTEAAAAHTLYSMVNHDCVPNVRWECAGFMEFRGREGGVRKGQELMSCYCDPELGVKERREWMVGCLGGYCMCARCLREEKEMAAK